MAVGGAYGLPGFDPTFEPGSLDINKFFPGANVPLASGPTGLLSGSSLASTGATDPTGGGGAGTWQTALTKGLPLLLSLFAGKTDPGIQPIVDQIKAGASSLGKTGADLTATGTSALTKTLPYLSSLASGQPGAVQEATAPERARIIDQYDTARQAASRTGARSGGAASANVASYIKEASDVTTMEAGARSSAVNQLAQLGSALTTTGLSASETSINELTNVLGPIFQQQQADQKSLSNTFAGIGEFLAPLILAAL